MTNKKNIEPRKSVKVLVWENLQLLCLAGSVAGQCTIGASFLAGQIIWLVANTIALVRDFVLHRPPADKIKNATLLGITAGLITAYLLGFYG